MLRPSFDETPGYPIDVGTLPTDHRSIIEVAVQDDTELGRRHAAYAQLAFAFFAWIMFVQTVGALQTIDNFYTQAQMTWYVLILISTGVFILPRKPLLGFLLIVLTVEVYVFWLLPAWAMAWVLYGLQVGVAYLFGLHFVWWRTTYPFPLDKCRALRAEARWGLLLSALIAPVCLPLLIWQLPEAWRATVSWLTYNRFGMVGPGIFQSPAGPRTLRVILFHAVAVFLGPLFLLFCLLTISPYLWRVRR